MNQFYFYQVVSGYVLRKFADEYLAIPVEVSGKPKAQVVIMSQSGSLLWKQLEEQCSIPGLVQTLTNEYEVSEEQARRDVSEFLNELDRANLLKPCSTTSTTSTAGTTSTTSTAGTTSTTSTTGTTSTTSTTGTHGTTIS